MNFNIIIPAPIVGMKNLKIVTKMFYGFLFSNINTDGLCNLTNSELAEGMDMSERQIQRYLRILEDKKLIVIFLYHSDNAFIVNRKIKVYFMPFETNCNSPIHLSTGDKNVVVYISNINTQEVTSNSNIKTKQLLVTNKSKLLPLTDTELWDISLKLGLFYDDVKEKQDEIFETIENGDKYKVKSIKLTLISWLKMGIKKNQYEFPDKISREIDAFKHDPSRQEAIREKELQIEEEINNGKPIFDFSKFR